MKTLTKKQMQSVKGGDPGRKPQTGKPITIK